MIFDMFVIPEQDPRNAVETARYLDANGYGAAWIGDSPPISWGDVYATLALCSQATSRVRLRTGVTNPLTRQATVTANAIITIAKLSGGRADLGIGTGDSALRALGLKPSTLAGLARYVEEVRGICRDRGVRVPVYVAASGPKALTLAGRIADGAIVSVGTHPSLVRRALERIAMGAAEAGRTLADIDVAFMAGLSIADSWEEAKREAGPLAARRAKDAHYYPDFFFPPDLEHLRGEAESIATHYDYRQHLDADASHARFVTDRIVDAYTLAGTEEDCVRKIGDMRAAGANHLVMFPSGHDRLGAMRRFTDTVMNRL